MQQTVQCSRSPLRVPELVSCLSLSPLDATRETFNLFQLPNDFSYIHSSRGNQGRECESGGSSLCKMGMCSKRTVFTVHKISKVSGLSFLMGAYSIHVFCVQVGLSRATSSLRAIERPSLHLHPFLTQDVFRQSIPHFRCRHTRGRFLCAVSRGCSWPEDHEQNIF